MLKSAVGCLLVAAVLPAQANPYRIVSSCTGNVVYERTSFPTTPTDVGGLSNLRCTGPTGTDQLFQNSWYYRLRGDNQEWVFNNGASSGLQPEIIAPKGDQATLNWRNTDGRGFDAQLRQRVYSTGRDSGVLSECLTIRNPGSGPIGIDIFHYVDFDVCGAAGDSARFVGPPQQIEVVDATCANRAYHLGCGWTNYQVGPYSTIRTLLSNATLDNLNNSGLPFGPADYTGAYQWQAVVIPAGGSASFYVGLGCDRQLPCCDLSTIESYCQPKPGTNGIPRWGDNPLYVCGQTELKVLNGLPRATPFVFIGLQRSCIPFPPFGTIAVNPIATNFQMPPFDANGSSAVCLEVPWNAGLCGARLYMQAWFADQGAAGAPLAHTDGCCFTIGSL